MGDGAAYVSMNSKLSSDPRTDTFMEKLHPGGFVNAPHSTTGFVLLFQSLFKEGRGYAFPCDAAGTVDMDALGDKLRNSYFYARSVVGRELSSPSVRCGDIWH